MTHGQRRAGEEMVAVLPFAALSRETNPDLVNQGGGLEGLKMMQAEHLPGGEFSQIVIEIGVHDLEGVEAGEIVIGFLGQTHQHRQNLERGTILVKEKSGLNKNPTSEMGVLEILGVMAELAEKFRY